MASSLRVGVVGAGLAGLGAALALSEAGAEVQVFDKGRGPGGRLSTRRLDRTDPDRFHADHGAQYFTVREPVFAEAVRAWEEAGLCAAWEARFGLAREGLGLVPFTPESPRYVFTPRMNSLIDAWAQALPVTWNCEIAGAEQRLGRWSLLTKGGGREGPFDWILSAIPAPQADRFLERFPGVREKVAATAYAPSLTAMARFAEPLPLEVDGLELGEGALGWVARNNTKPGRPEGETWILQASPAYSSAEVESTKEEIAEKLLAAFWAETGLSPVPPIDVQGHRWLYAFVSQPLGAPFTGVPESKLILCGDWCLGPRIELAWLSGQAAARALLDASRGSAA